MSMNLGGMDLNLMFALDALLRERNVTRAAERLNLTQPTVSASLSRLRRHFDDELLRRNGNQFDLTPLAVRLQPLVEEALDAAQRMFGAHLVVDPTQSSRRFSILTSDYGMNVVGVPWSSAVARFAPSIRMVFSTLAMEALDPPEVRLRDVDGVIAPQGFVPDSLPHIDLVSDRWVIVADASTTLSAYPSIEELRALPWATAFEGPSRTPAGLHRSEWARMAPRVSVVVDAFASIPLAVRGTKRVALMQERLISALGADHGLRILEPPMRTEPIRLAFWWHPSYTADPEHRWLRAHLGPFRESAATAMRKAGTPDA